MKNLSCWTIFSVVICFSICSALSGQERLILPEWNTSLRNVFDSIQAGPKIKTQIRLLVKNEAAWYTRWKMVEEARESIDTTYFIIKDDVFGLSFLGLLRTKALEGVKIRLMVDSRTTVWGGFLTDKLQELAGLPNVQVKFYNSVSKEFFALFKDLRNVIASNHDKIIIVDKKLAIIGGRNIAADYFAGKGECPIVYRDTDILMNGGHVAERLKYAFDEEWMLLKNSLLKPDSINFHDQNLTLDVAYRSMKKYMMGQGFVSLDDKSISGEEKKIFAKFNKELSTYKEISRYSDFRIFNNDPVKEVKILDKHSCVGVRNDISSNLIKFIDASKEEIILQSPYVVLSTEAINALQRASERGVKIIIHTNSGASTDNLMTQAFFLNDWKMLLSKCPKMRLLVARDKNDRLHSKTFVFDKQLTVIGSFNLDPLSDQCSSEVVGAVSDRIFGLNTSLKIAIDLKTALEYKIEIDYDTGKVTVAFGPEVHVDSGIMMKMNLLRKLQWLRPLI
ncbi:MAG: phosphatidylserine/phosphatidylglycerophosphate/cardiolipin synthase family protein [Candidatus Riflebacteria bacterium]|nr:phosphatidylserine/phosphatidylglycerophosphate/cardiolipin synthase family protein [Candidatus Riflebacteria bacterium]